VRETTAPEADWGREADPDPILWNTGRVSYPAEVALKKEKDAKRKESKIALDWLVRQET